MLFLAKIFKKHCEMNFLMNRVMKLLFCFIERVKVYFEQNESVGLLSRKIKKNSQLKDLFHYSFWSVIGTFVSKLSLMLIWIFIARLLGVNAYGEFSIVRHTVLLFSEFVGVSLMIAATKYVAENVYDKEALQRMIGNLFFVCFSLGVILSVLLFFFSNYLSINMIKAPHLYNYIAVTSILMLFVTLNKCQFGVMQGLGEFKLIAKINLIQVIFSFPFFYVSTKLYGLMGAVCGYVFYNIIVWIISHFYLSLKLKKLNIKVSFLPDFKIVKMILMYIIPYLIALVLAHFSAWYNEIKLVSISTNGFFQMGNYTAVMTLQNVILNSIVLFCIPFVSLMTKYKEKENDLLVKINYFMPLYLGMFLLMLVVMVPEVLYLIYGSSYANKQVYQIVVIIALYTPLLIFKQSLSRSVAVYEKQKIYLLDYILMAIITIGGFDFFQEYGLLAMIFSIIAANLFSILIFTPIYVRVKMIDKHLLNFKLLGLPFLFFLIVGLCYFVLIEYMFIRIVLMLIIYVLVGITAFRYMKNNLIKHENH